jgi:hypothetical protein
LSMFFERVNGRRDFAHIFRGPETKNETDL